MLDESTIELIDSTGSSLTELSTIEFSRPPITCKISLLHFDIAIDKLHSKGRIYNRRKLLFKLIRCYFHCYTAPFAPVLTSVVATLGCFKMRNSSIYLRPEGVILYP